MHRLSEGAATPETTAGECLLDLTPSSSKLMQEHTQAARLATEAMDLEWEEALAMASLLTLGQEELVASQMLIWQAVLLI